MKEISYNYLVFNKKLSKFTKNFSLDVKEEIFLSIFPVQKFEFDVKS